MRRRIRGHGNRRLRYGEGIESGGQDRKSCPSPKSFISKNHNKFAIRVFGISNSKLRPSFPCSFQYSARDHPACCRPVQSSIAALFLASRRTAAIERFV